MKFLLKLTKRTKTNSRGDTIIEVLISSAILALVLGTAYAVSTHSLRTGTTAGQRNQALGYAQSQIEFIKEAQVLDPAKLATYTRDPGIPFCIDVSGTHHGNLPVIPPPPAQFNTYKPCLNYDDQIYAVKVRYNSSLQVFTIDVWWAGANLTAEDSHLVLFYKLPGNYAQPPTVNLNANPNSVASGSASTLVWSSANATGCMASGGWTGAKSTNSSQSTGNLNVTTSYTLTCSGPGGSANDSDTVTVTNPSPPPPPGPPPPGPPPPGPPPPGSGSCPNPQSGGNGTSFPPNACVRNPVVAGRPSGGGSGDMYFNIWASHCYSGLSVSYPGGSTGLSWVASPDDNSSTQSYSVSNASSSSGTVTVTCSGNGTSTGSTSVVAFSGGGGSPPPPPPGPQPPPPPPTDEFLFYDCHVVLWEHWSGSNWHRRNGGVCFE